MQQKKKCGKGRREEEAEGQGEQVRVSQKTTHEVFGKVSKTSQRVLSVTLGGNHCKYIKTGARKI